MVMLAVSATQEASDMDWIDSVRARLEHAGELPAVLDAAYDAFEDMLGAIEVQQDPSGGAFAAFVMAGAAAANGRNAAAPSGDLARTAAGSPGGLSAEAAATVLAAVSQLLARRLAQASDLSADLGDRIACAQAARHAASICSLLGGTPEP
jgi:hypothetical protein